MTNSPMDRAIELARTAGPEVHPNPRVGAVLVLDSQIIGQGYHPGPGHPHAEEAAIQSALEGGASPQDLSRAELYCTLEPCCSTYPGKHRPACTDLIIRHRIARVIIATLDPNPRVRGRGISALRRAGIDVDIGPGAAQALSLNPDYLAMMLTRELPGDSQSPPQDQGEDSQEVPSSLLIPGDAGVTLKIATSWEGQIGPSLEQTTDITSPAARDWARVLRGNFQAVIFGLGTLLTDNPRYLAGAPGYTPVRQPLRVIMDTRLNAARPGADLALVDTLDAGPVLIFCGPLDSPAMVQRSQDLQARGFQIQALQPRDVHPLGGLNPGRVLEHLRDRGITRTLVETGPRLSASFLRAGLVNRLLWFREPVLLGRGINAMEYLPGFPGGPNLPLKRRYSWQIGSTEVNLFDLPADNPNAHGISQEAAYVHRTH